jgi:hypothetical protein
MGVDEPVTPVFPNSDYCTGIAGCIAILLALLRRAETGGSYAVDLALNYYNVWLINSVGTYPYHVFDKVWNEHGKQVLRNWHGMAYSIPQVLGGLGKGKGRERVMKEEFFEEREAKGVLGDKRVRCVRPVTRWKEVVELGYQVGTRGNGIDRARWPGDLAVEVVT